MLRLSLALFLAATTLSAANAADLLFVRDLPSSYTSEEQARVTQFESWGYTVTPIHDGETQPTFDTAVGAADVAYVPCTIEDWKLLGKLRGATCGVVTETVDLDQEFGYASSDGSTQSATDMQGVDNLHSVTSGLPSGTVTITTSNQYLSTNGATLAGGMTTLSTNLSTLGLGVIETGGALDTSYAGVTTAPARRVRLPWGYSFTFSSLNSNGLTVLQNALSWASGGGSGSGLELHLKLDDASGLTAVDSSGNGHDGTLTNGPTWTTSAVRDGGLQFDGVDDRVEAGVVTISGSEITMAAWVYTEAFTYDGRIIIKSNGNAASQQEWGLTIDPEGRVQMRINAGGTWNFFEVADKVAIGRWHHIAGTYDGTDMRLYVDGVLVGTQAHTVGGAIDTQASRTTTLGDSIAGGRPLQGSIDDARVYGSVLSDAEIVELYGLVGHWKLNETSGTTLADDSPNGNGATFSTGTPVWTTGARSGGLDFDGSNEAATGVLFDPPAEGSVACWFRMNAAPASVQRLFGVQNHWELRVESTGDVFCDLGDSTFGLNSAAGVAEADRWVHVAATYSSDTGDYQMYVNGQSVASGNAALADIDAGTLSFGARTGSTERFDGVLDDVRVYSYEISARQVAELYGLIGHWKLDEASGATAADSTPSGLDGAYTGGVTLAAEGPYPGQGADAAELDGAGGYIDLPDLVVDYEDGCTLSCWARPTSTGVWERFLDLGNGAGGDNLLFSREATSNNLAVHLYGGSLGSSQTIAATDGLVNDEWRHYVAVIDHQGTATLYRDAVPLTSGAIGVPSSVRRTSNYIGRSNWSADADFEGRLHDVRLYNRPLSQARIAELYGLVAHWKLDELSGTTAYDSSGMDHHATLTGTANWTTARVDGGVELDYTNGEDYFTAPSTPVLDDLQEGDYSVAAWFRPSSAPPGTGSDHDSSYGILLKSGYHAGLIYNNGTELQMDDWLTGGVWNGAGAWAPFPAGQFHHVAGVVCRDEGTVKIYVDGVLKETANFTPGTASHEFDATPWRIGVGQPGGVAYGYPCDGVIDDARLYNRALSVDEIQAAYQSGLTQGLRIIRWVEVR